MKFGLETLLNPAGALIGQVDKTTEGMGTLGKILNPMEMVDKQVNNGVTNMLGPKHADLAGALLGQKVPAPPSVGAAPSAPGPSPFIFSSRPPMGFGAPPPGAPPSVGGPMPNMLTQYPGLAQG